MPRGKLLSQTPRDSSERQLSRKTARIVDCGMWIVDRAAARRRKRLQAGGNYGNVHERTNVWEFSLLNLTFVNSHILANANGTFIGVNLVGLVSLSVKKKRWRADFKSISWHVCAVCPFDCIYSPSAISLATDLPYCRCPHRHFSLPR